MAEVAQQTIHQFQFGQFHRSSDTEYRSSGQRDDGITSHAFAAKSTTSPRPSNPMSTSAPRTHTRAINSLSALPAFSFNPSASLTSPTDTSNATPPPTVSAPTTPARAARHRRTASELTGGNASGFHLQNRSPSKTWLEGFSAPSTPSYGSLPSRLDARYHSHGDTLSHDSALQEDIRTGDKSIQASTVVSGEATATTRHFQTDGTTRFSTSLTTSPRQIGLLTESGYTPKAPSRNRVGFSESIEFIPRPLSTISSESGDSMSTIRAHSVSGSISSVMAAGSTSPLSKALHSPLRKSIDGTSSPLRIRSPQEDLQADIEPLKLSGTDTLLSAPAVPNMKASQSQDVFVSSFPSASESSLDTTQALHKRQRKVGSWTVLLGRKPRSASSSCESPVLGDILPQPDSDIVEPSVEHTAAVELSEDFDADPTSMIISNFASFEGQPIVTPPLTPSERSLPDDGSGDPPSSTVIDLDAVMSSEPWHDPRFPKPRSLIGTRRSMHSNATSSGFFAVASHRRADSAPSFASNSFDPAGFRERNSSMSSFKRSKMEDVFEEDEDAAEKVLHADRAKDSAHDTVPTHSAKANDSLPSAQPWANLDSTVDVDTKKFQVHGGPRSPHHLPTTNVQPSMHDESLVSIRHDNTDTYEHRRPSSETAYLTVNDFPSPKYARSVDMETFPLRNRTTATNETRTGSPLSTPCGCGNDCSSVRRRDTSASFGPDSRRTYAHSVAERGSELRYSVDDVPSLISSRSTVTSAVHARPPSLSSRGFPLRSTGSSLSLSSTVDRHQKRSSMANFSRFVGSSFGERTREPLEPGKRWQHPLEAKDVKIPKPSRLSRLLRFLKPRPS